MQAIDADRIRAKLVMSLTQQFGHLVVEQFDELAFQTEDYLRSELRQQLCCHSLILIPSAAQTRFPGVIKIGSNLWEILLGPSISQEHVMEIAFVCRSTLEKP